MIEEVDQELWQSAVANVIKQQEETYKGLFDEAFKEHLKHGWQDCKCRDCVGGVCLQCKERIVFYVERLQDSQFEDQAEAEFARLLEPQEKRQTE